MPISVCISREYGSGGRAIGQILATDLGFEFYDGQLVDLAAEKGAIPIKNAMEADEHALNPWLYTPLYSGVYSNFHDSDPERMFRLQSEIIKEAANKHNCVFVGRSADTILEDERNVDLVNLYIYAPQQWRAQRLVKTEGYNDYKEATIAMHKKDKQRRNYYNYYSGREYADPVNYDLCIDSSFLGIEKTAQLLEHYLKFVFDL